MIQYCFRGKEMTDGGVSILFRKYHRRRHLDSGIHRFFTVREGIIKKIAIKRALIVEYARRMIIIYCKEIIIEKLTSKIHYQIFWRRSVEKSSDVLSTKRGNK
jgi:hypothetical protein